MIPYHLPASIDSKATLIALPSCSTVWVVVWCLGIKGIMQESAPVAWTGWELAECDRYQGGGETLARCGLLQRCCWRMWGGAPVDSSCGWMFRFPGCRVWVSEQGWRRRAQPALGADTRLFILSPFPWGPKAIQGRAGEELVMDQVWNKYATIRISSSPGGRPRSRESTWTCFGMCTFQICPWWSVSHPGSQASFLNSKA